MKKLIYIIPLLLCSFLPAQEVALSYEIVPLTENKASMHVYLQSLTAEDVYIKAINYSLAIPEGCVKITGQEAIFSDAWTDYLQEVQMINHLDLNYNSWHYSNRWQYGSADPGLPGTVSVIAPAQGKEALQIMQINLEGSCTDKLYLERQDENPVNQMGDDDILPVEWTVIHPKTDLALQNGLSLEVYPNPVQDYLNLHFEGAREQNYQVELFAIDGKKLQEKELKTQETGELKLDMSHLPSAVYVLSISKNSGQITSVGTIKVVKK